MPMLMSEHLLHSSFPVLLGAPTFPWCFPGGSDSKESTCNAGRPGTDPWIVSEGNPQISGLPKSVVLLVSRILQILLACFPTGPCVVSSRLRRWAYGALEWLWQDRLPAGTLHSLHSGHMSIQFTFIRSLCHLLDGCVLGEKGCGLVPARPRGLEHQDSSWVS